MLLRITGAGLAGWGAIVGLAWWLADRRMAVCDTGACVLRAASARDGVLTHGLTIALVAAIVVALIAFGRARRDHEASPFQAQAPRLARLPGVAKPGPARVRIAALAVLMFAAGWFGAQLYRTALAPSSSPTTAQQAEAAAIDAAAAATDAAAYQATQTANDHSYEGFSAPVVYAPHASSAALGEDDPVAAEGELTQEE